MQLQACKKESNIIYISKPRHGSMYISLCVVRKYSVSQRKEALTLQSLIVGN